MCWYALLVKWCGVLAAVQRIRGEHEAHKNDRVGDGSVNSKAERCLCHQNSQPSTIKFKTLHIMIPDKLMTFKEGWR